MTGITFKPVFWFQVWFVLTLSSVVALLLVEAIRAWNLQRRMEVLRRNHPPPNLGAWEPKFCPDCGTTLERLSPEESRRYGGKVVRCPVCRHDEEGGAR